jgi:hypothetical protein
MKIAICFFGIPRSLKRTAPCISGRIIEPTKQFGEVSVYAHYFSQKTVHNLRAGEVQVPVDPHEWKALDYTRVRWDEPNDCLTQWDFPALKAAGDAWGDEFWSLRNHVHQLSSLLRVLEMAMYDRPDMVIYLRPDLRYHDNIGPILKEVIAQKFEGIVVPDWQWWWGVNDRFSICVGQDAIQAYGRRIEMAKSYIKDLGKPIHAERLLKYALDTNDVPIRTVNMRASRVRANGHMQEESFEPSPEALSTPQLFVK